jgi:hypothetical protein
VIDRTNQLGDCAAKHCHKSNKRCLAALIAGAAKIEQPLFLNGNAINCDAELNCCHRDR